MSLVCTTDPKKPAASWDAAGPSPAHIALVQRDLAYWDLACIDPAQMALAMSASDQTESDFTMITPEDRLAALSLTLPPPVVVPDGLHLPFAFINVRGDRAMISGHAAHDHTGKISGPFGQLGTDMTTQDGYDAAREIGLCVLANLKAEIGDLSRVAGWMRVFGMVNSAPGYKEQHLAINGFSDLILDVFGPETGRHSRSAMGAAGMPMNFAIEIEAEVLLT